MNNRPVIARLEIWGDGVMMSKKDWSKIVRWLKRAEINVVYQTRNMPNKARTRHIPSVGKSPTKKSNRKVTKPTVGG